MINQEDLYNLIKLSIQKQDVLIELMYQNNKLLSDYFIQKKIVNDENN